MPTLFDPVRFGALHLPNRVVMAPLTRNRAPGQTPSATMATYYRQRASAGLLISEATPISPMAHGYLDTPGLHSDAQVAAWKPVTQAVHEAGGRIVVQLWHVGRISHTSLLPGGVAPVSSTPVRADAKTYVAAGFEPVSAPRALRDDELPALVADYAAAARRALDAGFDGVEVHGANGYLLEQFLRDAINDRAGPYGGDLDGRTRLMVEAVQAVAAAIGADRTGLRISPVTPSNGAAQDGDPQALHAHLASRLAPLGLAYVHVVEGQTGGARDLTAQGGPAFDYAALRRAWGATPWLVNNGYTRAMALAAVAEGRADAVAFGRPFIANPDLVRRLREDAPLNALDVKTLYGGGAAGYTDYPALA